MSYFVVPVGSSEIQDHYFRDLDDSGEFDFSQNSIQVTSTTTSTGKYFYRLQYQTMMSVFSVPRFLFVMIALF